MGTLNRRAHLIGIDNGSCGEDHVFHLSFEVTISVQDEVNRLAAKFSRDGRAIHPLICHMVDVAAVAEIVWRDCLAVRTRTSLVEALGLDEDQAGRWVAYLAGLHDLGKASPVFQAKGSHDNRSTPWWLMDSELEFELSNETDPGHGTITAAYLPALLTSDLQLDSRTAERLSVITGGHHGIFPTAAMRRKVLAPNSIGEPTRGEENPWAAARRELTLTLAELLGVDGTPSTLSNAASLALAGLVSVVDWIGSIDDERFFPFAPEGVADLTAYQEDRRIRAERAIQHLLWDAWRAKERPPTFQTLFPSITRPRPLQTQVPVVAAASSLPALVIVEAPMGEGKTEVAFYLSEYWNASGLRGSYIAMPTQATSNQLHKRFREFLQRRYGATDQINLQLLHGHASLVDAIKLIEDARDAPQPTGIDTGDEASEASVGVAEWFTYRKRGLLAPFGVGTVDQALMSVLQVKHGFVRLFGLAGKTIVIDEVHAYDTYMSTLLERLLEWLAAMGSPVVLLSATLPAVRRTALVAAYLRGLGQDAPLTIASAKYPRLTAVDSRGVEEYAVEASDQSRRSLAIRWLDCGVNGLPEILLDHLRDGGCAAVICNTVGGAQSVYAALKEAVMGLPEGERPVLDLFHARFLFKDRQKREERCLARFGKPDRPGGTTADRPQRAILVATQVIEQSLDLDFDLMVSELAPIDLLLQRSGRILRHDRADRRGEGRPLLQIMAPSLDGYGVPRFDRAVRMVYDEHILLRTWLALRNRSAVVIPEDVEWLINEVYHDSPNPPEDADAALMKRWSATFEAMEQKRQEERQEAMLRRIPSPAAHARLDDYTRDPREEDAPELHPALQAVTRLGEPSVDVVLLAEDSPLIASLDCEPSRSVCRDVLEYSVSLNAPDVVREVLDIPVPEAWRKTAILQRTRVLVLSESHDCQVGNITLRYDAEVGLQIIRA